MDEMTVLAEADRQAGTATGLSNMRAVTTYIRTTIGITARIKAVAPETLEPSLARPSACSTSGRRNKTPNHGRPGGGVHDNQSLTRDMLTSSIALAAGAGGAPFLASVSSAMADTTVPTAAEIVADIRSKKMTPSTPCGPRSTRGASQGPQRVHCLNRDGALAAAAGSTKARRPVPSPVCLSSSRTTSHR